MAKVNKTTKAPRAPQKISKKDIQEQFSSIAEVVKFVFKYYKLQCICVLICIIISAVGFTSIVLFMQQLVDQFIVPMLSQQTPDFGPLANKIIQMTIVAIITVAAMYAYQKIIVYVTNGNLIRLRKLVYKNMQKLPINYFDTNAHGDIMSVYTNDIDTINQLVRNSLPQLVSQFFNLICAFAGMILLNIPLTIVSCIMVAVMLFVTSRLAGLSGKYFGNQQRDLGAINGYIEESMTGQKVIKVFCHEEQSINDFKKLNNKLFESAKRANMIANITMPINANIANLNYVFIAVIGALLTLWGWPGMTIGTIVSFLAMCKAFTQPVTQISMQVGIIVMAGAGASRVFKLAKQKPESNTGKIKLVRVEENQDGKLVKTKNRSQVWAWEKTINGKQTLIPLKGKIEFNNVDFSYDKDKQILFDITMHAKPGQKIAFVGSTGAGKTTMTNLINRFYDIQKGSITYDNIDIKDIDKTDLRKSLGIVLQDTHLFSGTIMENIRYGRLDATDEECIEAAKVANAHSFIKRMPNGYNMKLSADGTNLSLGQRQLISIARATVANPPALILDEATSSIDTHTESQVQAGMDALMKGRTSFVIAHRLSTIRNANCIMVMENGRIIERGNHDELIAQKGRYYTLYTGDKANGKN